MFGVIQGIGQSILHLIFIGVYSVGFNPSFGAGFKEYCTFLGKGLVRSVWIWWAQSPKSCQYWQHFWTMRSLMPCRNLQSMSALNICFPWRLSKWSIMWWYRGKSSGISRNKSLKRHINRQFHLQNKSLYPAKRFSNKGNLLKTFVNLF